jgi:hypothetical protein
MTPSPQVPTSSLCVPKTNLACLQLGVPFMAAGTTGLSPGGPTQALLLQPTRPALQFSLIGAARG